MNKANEINPDWLCDNCGRAGKIEKIIYADGSIEYHCHKCFNDSKNKPRLHGPFHRYRTDDINLTVSVNEYNNAVDKIEYLMKEIEQIKNTGSMTKM